MIAATDFFTTEVWTARGLVTCYTLFVIDLATRPVCIAGTTTHPDASFMAQVARNLTDCMDGFLGGKRILILDRMIFVGEGALRNALREYVIHYNSERPHQGIGNAPIVDEVQNPRGPVIVRERLGGMLKHYRRAAA